MNMGATHQPATDDRFETKTKMTNDAIWDWDLTTNKMWWNEGFKNIFGYTEAEPTIDSWTSRIHPHDIERITTAVKQVIANESDKWGEEYRFLRADGTYAYVFGRGYAIVQNNKPLRVVGCMIDITAQKQLQTAKEESEEWIRFALDAAGLGTWDFDIQSGMIKWDKRCRELNGWSKGEDIKLENILVHIHPDDLKRVEDSIADAINPAIKGDYHIEFRVIGAEDKVERWIRSKGKAHFNEDGTAKRLSGIVQDITKEKNNRQEQDMLLKLVDNTPEFVAMATAEGKVIYLNNAGRKLVGIGPNENVHDIEVRNFYLPEFYTFLEKDVLPALFRNSHWSGKIHLKHFKTDEQIPCHAEFITINDPATGKVLVRGVTMRDLRPEYAAQAEQLKLLTLVDNSVDMMSILRLDGKNSYINKAGKVLLGLDENADVTEISISEFHTPEQISFVQQEILPNVMKNGRWSGRFAIKHLKTGEIIPLENNSLRIDDAITGQPIAIGAVMRDLRPEMAAQSEQRRLLALLENTNDFVSLSDISGNVSYVNASGLRMMGFENLEEAKRHNTEYVMPGEVNHVKYTIYKALMERGVWSGEVLYRHFKTREAIPVQGTTMMVYDPVTRQPQGRATIVRDLRPERAAQKALRESEQLFRSIATALPLILWMSNAKGEITFMNQKWVEFLGLPGQPKFDGQIWYEAIVEEDREAAVQTYSYAMQSATTLSMEFRVKRADGKIIWTYSLGQPQYDQQGNYTGFLGYTIDITAQKELQRQKDEFIGIASHELKTPVTSIKAYAQLLKEMSAVRGDTLETQMLTKMDGQITKLSNLIRDLLDVTKIQAGKLQFNDAYFDFDKLVEEVLEEMQRTTNRHQIVWQGSDLGIIYGDEHRISQVITNLLSNAIKYSPNADRIIVTASKENNEVKLSVQDFGIGIPKDNLEKVFEQFYRVSNNKQHLYPGLGLGLYISAEIIRREGGKIGVESTEGEGSIFYFTLPIDSKKDSA
ncbi:PAS domain S-box protein [Ilyomonas limi]|uniref:histidine kinase n=1 Tax=Ilyomonas limi TaxID=2575867 RepID=A0A4U3KT16_9BACT|nr:PAS domain-containing sensor histidine kinase [Ilyomonas limi]TKK65538.1 PAS domain S-box protein [Ilyomonas limi]